MFPTPAWLCAPVDTRYWFRSVMIPAMVGAATEVPPKYDAPPPVYT